jgi:hypothetical protein
MIQETLMAVQQFSPREQSQPVEELRVRWLPRDDEEIRATLVVLLEVRMAHYRQLPETASTWDEERQRLERLRQCRR